MQMTLISDGLDISDNDLLTLTSIDTLQWLAEMDAIGEYLESYGERLPEALMDEQRKVSSDLKASALEKAS